MLNFSQIVKQYGMLCIAVLLFLFFTAGAEMLAMTNKEIKIKLAETGPFAIWSGKGMPKADGITFTDAGNGLYRANLAATEGSCVIIITR